MNWISFIVAVGIIFILILAVLLLSDRTKNIQRRSKHILFFFLLINLHFSIDALAYQSGFQESNYVGYSYIYFHLNGLLIYLFALSTFQNNLISKLWITRIVIYSILRLGLLVILEAYSNESDVYIREQFSTIYFVDYSLAITLNLVFLIKSYRIIGTSEFALSLSHKENIIHSWFSHLLLFSMMIYSLMAASSVLGAFYLGGELIQLILEEVLMSITMIAVAFFSIKYPIFSVHGNFKQLDPKFKVKYANSSLKGNAIEPLWLLILSELEQKKKYRNPEYRLNNLAEDVGYSVHHVSQCINEKCKMSFSEFINQFRISEAKELLISEKATKLTIIGVAYDVGFNSKSTFYNAFKKNTGLTPTAYQKNES